MNVILPISFDIMLLDAQLRRVYNMPNWLNIRFAFGNILTHSLTHAVVSSMVKGGFSSLKVRRRFLCMYKIFRRLPTNCPYADGSSTERNSSAVR